MNAALPYVACMELLKIVLVASYFFLPFDRSPPFIAYFLIFFVAVVFGWTLRFLGGRAGHRLLGHLLGFTVAALILCGWYGGGVFAFGTLPPHGGAAILEFTVLVCWMAVVWVRGGRLSASSTAHGRVILLFDVGLGAFLLLQGFGALIGINNPVAERLVVPYLFCSFLALVFSDRESYRRRKRFGPSKTAPLIAAATAIMAATVATAAPGMMDSASRAGRVAAAAFSAAEPYIVFFLRLLFRAGGASRPQETAFTTGTEAIEPVAQAEVGPFDHVLSVVVMSLVWAMIAFGLVFFASLAAVRLWALLSRRSDSRHAALPPFLAFLAAVVRKLASPFRYFFSLFAPRGKRRSPALASYARLLFWGRLFGLPRRATETPHEYGERAAATFRRRAAYIRSVIRAVESETYGGKSKVDVACGEMVEVGRNIARSLR